ncbi:MAG: reductive dehalogenase, partial [Anaerolineaceae bacterium]|nr:reductive dehalogenase [Anaerolineaceae bacterium]
LGAAGILDACNVIPGFSPTATSRFEAFPVTDNIDLLTPEGGPVEIPTYTPGPSPTPMNTAAPGQITRVVWQCASCGQTFYSVDALKNHAAEEHSWRLPVIQRVNQPTYSEFLVGDVEQFDQKNIVFARLTWDEEYQVLVAQAATKTPADDWDTFEGRALTAGAIYVDATVGSLHPNYYGYFGHVNEIGGLYGWDDPVNPMQLPDPDPVWMSERIKQAGHFYGADLVGITSINPLWVYSHYFELASGDYGKLEIPYKYAIVMGIEMKWDEINKSPKPEASAATALAYSQMSEVASSLAKYIRALGYEAIPCGNDTLQSIPLAIDAGLGELGRNGLLISPQYGPRQRICKVLTNLPLQVDKPIDFGMRSYCETCHACAGACPVNAIRKQDRTTEQTSISNRPGILRWPVDVAKCYLFWTENGTDCSNCVAACPWGLKSTRGWLED